METVVPFVMMLLIGTLAVVLYLGRRREEAAREQALGRRIKTFVPLLPRVVNQPQPVRARPLPSSFPMTVTLDLLRYLDRWLAQAGMTISATRFLALVISIGAGATALAAALRIASLIVVVCGLGVAAVPAAYVYIERNRRLATFSQQLPYVLDFLRSALSAGHTLLRGVQMATENSPEPIATELRLVVDQIRLGTNLADALENMFRRAPEESLGFLVAAVRVQADVGSSISEILDRVTDTIRDRQRLQQEIRTLTAQTRMSGMIVAALPFLLLGFFTIIRPTYTYPLFHDPLGIRMLEAAIVLDAVAMLSIRHMVQVD
jgi:tight adherence protein B